MLQSMSNLLSNFQSHPIARAPATRPRFNSVKEEFNSSVWKSATPPSTPILLDLKSRCARLWCRVSISDMVTQSASASILKGPTSPRIVTSKQHSKAYVDAAYCTVNTFIRNIPNTLLSPHSIVRILHLFLGISILSAIPCLGGSSPLSLPPSTSQAPSLEEHIAKGQEEKGR